MQKVRVYVIYLEAIEFRLIIELTLVVNVSNFVPNYLMAKT